MGAIPATDGRVVSPVRWAGGKRWLLPTIKDLIGDTEITAYHEPFLGGASIFLGLSQFPKAHLGDMNAELIATFRVIRDHPERLGETARRHANDSETYYEVRESSPAGAVERASRFIYLNHTSFNGIYRVNLAGKYNVPFGGRRSPQIPSAEHLRSISRAGFSLPAPPRISVSAPAMCWSGWW
jgi:DNA adenine methylase